MWKLFEDGLTMLTEGKLSKKDLSLVLMTWNGTTGVLGWKGVASSLAPTLRGPTAYVLGHRFMKLGKPDDAPTFFQTALKDAPPDSTLRKLAEAEVRRRNEAPGK